MVPRGSRFRSFARRVLLALAVLGASSVASGASAQTDAERYRARDIERTTLSPFCPGRTLYDCPSPRAAEWREDIRGWVAEGRSDAEIREALRERAPDSQLASEGPAAAVVVALVVVLGLAFAVWGIRERRRGRRDERDAPDETETRAVSDEEDAALDARLEDELGRIDHDLA